MANTGTDFFTKKTSFSVVVKLSAKNIDGLQIWVDTIKLNEKKVSAKFFIPRNSKKLNVEKLLKHSFSVHCFRSKNIC